MSRPGFSDPAPIYADGASVQYRGVWRQELGYAGYSIVRQGPGYYLSSVNVLPGTSWDDGPWVLIGSVSDEQVMAYVGSAVQAADVASQTAISAHDAALTAQHMQEAAAATLRSLVITARDAQTQIEQANLIHEELINRITANAAAITGVRADASAAASQAAAASASAGDALTRINALSASVSSYPARITSVSASVSAVDARSTAVSAALSNTSGRVDLLQSSVSSQTSQVSALQAAVSGVSSLQTAVSGALSQISALQAAVSAVQAALGNKNRTYLGYGQVAVPALALLATTTAVGTIAPVAMPDTNYQVVWWTDGAIAGKIGVTSVTKTKTQVTFGLSALLALGSGSNLYFVVIETANPV